MSRRQRSGFNSKTLPWVFPRISHVTSLLFECSQTNQCTSRWTRSRRLLLFCSTRKHKILLCEVCQSLYTWSVLEHLCLSADSGFIHSVRAVWFAHANRAAELDLTYRRRSSDLKISKDCASLISDALTDDHTISVREPFARNIGYNYRRRLSEVSHDVQFCHSRRSRAGHGALEASHGIELISLDTTTRVLIRSKSPFASLVSATLKLTRHKGQQASSRARHDVSNHKRHFDNDRYLDRVKGDRSNFVHDDELDAGWRICGYTTAGNSVNLFLSHQIPESNEMSSLQQTWCADTTS